jgi:hypothetical protein
MDEDLVVRMKPEAPTSDQPSIFRSESLLSVISLLELSAHLVTSHPFCNS